MNRNVGSRNKIEDTVSQQLELNNKIRDKGERIAILLSPIESYILLLQRILVWELPYASAVLYVAVHILFWLSTSVRIYCLFGITCIILVALDLWILHISPSNSGSGSGENNLSSWTEVHPDLCGVPELSHHLAKFWVHGVQLLDSSIALRNDHRPKFFVLSLVYLTALAVVGAYVPGVWIAYVSVMGLMLWPFVKYHKVYEKLNIATSPLFHRVENKLNIRRKRRRTKRGSKHQQIDDTFDDDSDDAIIDEFVPPVNPVVMTTLTSALSNEMVWDDDEDDANDLLSGDTPTDRLTPQLTTLSYSHDQSDDDMLADELSYLTRGLGNEMPSINDVDGGSGYDSRDRVADASLDPDDALLDNMLGNSDDDDGISPPLPSSALRRVADNESDDSETEVDSFAAGLTFTDVDTIGGTAVERGGGDFASATAGLGGKFISNLLSQGHSTLSAALASPAISGIVSGTTSGLSALRDVVGRALPTHSSTTAGDELATDSDVLDAEFEFLDQEELDDDV